MLFNFLIERRRDGIQVVIAEVHVHVKSHDADAWPSILCTAFTFARAQIASDAAVCRRSCTVTFGKVGSLEMQRSTAALKMRPPKLPDRRTPPSAPENVGISSAADRARSRSAGSSISGIWDRATLVVRGQLEETSETVLTNGASVVIAPDYRAHKAPFRAKTIADLTDRMAGRLATLCPHCETPGFGGIDIERGLPCSLCGSPTPVIRADIHGCGRCDHRTQVSRGHTTADPEWCDNCNP